MAEICCIRKENGEHNPDLRQASEELHARAFYDFDGAGRFIRFVYLVGNDSAVLNYMNDFLRSRACHQPPKNFIGLNQFALRVERHTEFLTISFVEKGLKVQTGISKDVQKQICRICRLHGRETRQPLFHAIVEVAGNSTKLQQLTC